MAWNGFLSNRESECSGDIESVHAALLKVFRDLKRAKRFEIMNPTLLKHAFAQHQSSFWGCIQQDAHEFFCSLIDKVQEDVSSALKKQYSVEADRPKLETVCPTTQNFSCSVRNNLTCAGCGNVSSVEETYCDFSLALPEDERTDEATNCSLDSLLNLYFQDELSVMEYVVGRRFVVVEAPSTGNNMFNLRVTCFLIMTCRIILYPSLLVCVWDSTCALHEAVNCFETSSKTIKNSVKNL